MRAGSREIVTPGQVLVALLETAAELLKYSRQLVAESGSLLAENAELRATLAWERPPAR
jgi:hypothetical protein